MADLGERKGQPAVSVVAYLSTCLLSSVGFVLAEYGRFDIGIVGLVATAVALFALIPFLLVKGVMGAFACDGLVFHVLGGAFAAMIAVVLFLSHGEAFGFAMPAYFSAWGAFSGLVYWTVRQLAQHAIYGADV